MSASHRFAARTETPASRAVVLPAVMGSRAGSPRAIWVGEVSDIVLDDSALPDRLVLEGGQHFSQARWLVRAGDGRPRGFVELTVDAGTVDTGDLRRAVRTLPGLDPERGPGRGGEGGASLLTGRTPQLRPPGPPGADAPSVSIVICTYDRPDSLRRTLATVRAFGPAVLELIVVDNHPQSGLTAPLLRALQDDALVRVIQVPERGLARARNAAVRAARGRVVAFTDDDTLVDAQWVTRLVSGFERGEDVACVTGLVPSAELTSPAQLFFDARVSWARSCRAEVFRVADCDDDPLFPFRVGRFGTGANFAMRTDVLRALGGFDERLGVGSPSGGGEDIDMFVRVLLAGHALAYEPAAIVWHRHRDDVHRLEEQIRDYGRGLGAWMSALLGQPAARALLVSRLVPGVVHLYHLTRGTAPVGVSFELARDLGRAERAAFLGGPIALVRGAATGARARPLAGPATARAPRRVRLWSHRAVPRSR